MVLGSDKLNNLIEKTLEDLLKPEKTEYKVLFDSMLYSVKAGGKRVRPMLCLAFASLCGANPEKALYPACAVEFIHTYSLIHDDLPCMDNDDMRRGKPSNHIAFSEDTPLLAGDALQGNAFEVLLSPENISIMGGDASAACAYTLAKLSGADGMVGGQVIDLALEEAKEADAESVSLMHSLKTAALIKAACVMGCVAAGADSDKIKAAETYAECIGLQFQIVDDILDVTSTTDVLGKPVNSDSENNKTNMVTLLGIEKCRELAFELTEKAKASLSVFDGDTTELKEFADSLLNRNK